MHSRSQEAFRTLSIELPSRGGAMAALDLGPPDRAPDIVFSHANGFNGRTYRSILAPLAERLRILAIDLRGHGATTLPTTIEGRQGWMEFTGDLLAFLAAAAPAPVVLAGHSMGGTTSLLAAAQAPARVRRLALFDPVIMPPGMIVTGETRTHSPLIEGALKRRAVFPSREAALAAYRGRGGFRTWSEAQIADYVAGGFVDLPSGEVALACAPQWEASNFSMHNIDPWPAFAATRCRVDILKAEQASTCRTDAHEAELTADGRIRIETVPGTSHFLPMERPKLVRAALAAAAA